MARGVVKPDRKDRTKYYGQFTNFLAKSQYGKKGGKVGPRTSQKELHTYHQNVEDLASVHMGQFDWRSDAHVVIMLVQLTIAENLRALIREMKENGETLRSFDQLMDFLGKHVD